MAVYFSKCEQVLPALAKSSIQQVSVNCCHSQVLPHLMSLLEGTDVMVGVTDLASDVMQTPEQMTDTLGKALQFVPRHRLMGCTNCGLAPTDRAIAIKKRQGWRRAQHWPGCGVASMPWQAGLT